MISEAQQYEIEKYIKIYGAVSDYRMGGTRYQNACLDLKAIEHRGSYLDVGCGRGEMLRFAWLLDFKRVMGTEVVPELYDKPGVWFALADNMPFEDGEFEVVSCLDVLEHLLPENTVPVLQELDRVTSKALLLTANNKPSNSLGVELHINKRPYEEWDELIREHCHGTVTWKKDTNNISETWLVEYD